MRFELQADCFAGVWLHSVYRRGQLTDADIKEALDAAAVVGDDFIRNAAGQTRPPEEWTHGSSAQRQQWLTTGSRAAGRSPATRSADDRRAMSARELTVFVWAPLFGSKC